MNDNAGKQYEYFTEAYLTNAAPRSITAKSIPLAAIAYKVAKAFDASDTRRRLPRTYRRRRAPYGGDSVIGKVLHQAKFDLLIFRRNPAATFFTLILPLIFLVIFTSLFGNNTLENGVKVSTYYVPGILTLAIVSATAVNLAITMTTRRERGVLKRIRATPLPSWVFIASQAIGGLVLSVLMTLIISAIGAVAYDAELPWDTMPSLIITLIIFDQS